MTYRALALAAALVAGSAGPTSGWAQEGRLPVDALRTPLGATREQVLLGDRIFHGEAAGGKCSECHGWDAKGTPNGNDLTVGMWIWSDGSMKMLKATILHNMSIAPGMDGQLTPDDVDAVVAYVWAIGHQRH